MPIQRYKSGAVAAVPPVAGSPSVGNPTEGTPATVIGAWWFHATGTTINNAIERAGLNVDDTLDQLAEAIEMIADARIDNWVGAAPGALDTVIELAAAVRANQNMLAALLTLGQADARYVRLVNAFTQGQADARYGVRRVVATRAEDVGSFNGGITTTLGSVQLTRTGRWLIVVSVDNHSDDSPNAIAITPVDLSIDGLSAALMARGESPADFVFGTAVRTVQKNNGDTVNVTATVPLTHRYGAVTIEAIYLGPSA